MGCGWRATSPPGVRTAGPNRLRGELAGNELRTRKEYVSDRDAGFKQPLERCKLLTRWAFKYFDQTGSTARSLRSLCYLGLSPLARFNYDASTATNV